MVTHPDVILELARMREQEIVRGALLAQQVRDARALRSRPGVRRGLIAWLRAWVSASDTRRTPGPTLPPILHTEIRREAR
jgi:hypothetical protein